MVDRLYNKIMNSIDKHIKIAIREQFNISDIDFNDDSDSAYDPNIFNKELYNINDIYNKVISKKTLNDDELLYLRTIVSAVPVDKGTLYDIIEYYSFHYQNEPLNWLDVSDITEMSNLFYNTTYKGDISKWDTSHATNMNGLFMHSQFNGDISGWDVSNVHFMADMFNSSYFNNDISKWNVSEVVNMRAMFAWSDFNQNISRWDVSNVIDMVEMFAGSKFRKNISSWDVSNVNYY